MARKRTLIAALAVAASAALALAGCSSTASSGSTPSASAAPLIKVAALTPGNTNDGGFNQSVLDALTKLKKEGLIQFQIRDQVADTATAEPIITDFASQGYDLIIGHGIELGDAIFAVAKNFPDVHFTASGGADILTKFTKNVETWTYSTSDAGYLSGYVAGATGLTPVARVESLQLPFITATDDAFIKGLAAANPAATTLPVVYTGSFDDAEKASSATTGLISQGAKLVYTTGDGIAAGVGSASASAGVATVGVTAASGSAAAKGNVSTVNLDMYPIFKAWVLELQKKKFGSKGVTSTIANGGLVTAEVNAPDGSASDTADTVKKFMAGVKDGSIKLEG